jgi:Ethanolamine utilization protein EutJ (predicted chaperonin)
MQLNQKYVEKLRDVIRQQPLEEGEIRPIHFAGEQYIAQTETDMNKELFIQQFSLKIDGVACSVYVTKLAQVV